MLDLDLLTRTVTCDGRELDLKARAFDLLATLAADPQRVFTPAELTAAVWPGRAVEDTNLRMQVQALRKALGPDAVRNLPGRGYSLTQPARLRQALRTGGNLPHWDDPMIGRAEDLATLDRHVAARRLVTVLGPGGIGKTRLAQQLARQRLSHHRDGAWWVDLAAVPARPTADQAVAQAVAQVLSLQTPQGSPGGAAGALVRLLADWQGLLLLDNAEHLCGPDGPLPALVQALLTGAPGAHLLVTSQQPLKLTAEWLYRLGTLALPGKEASPEQVRASAAVQLLQRRALAAGLQSSLSDDELPLAASLVRQLDGIPLAIEMAASRLPALGLELLDAQMRRHLTVLDGSAAQTRHRTLQAALDWSHALLSNDEQVALRQLSVFAAPFRLDTACELVALPGRSPDEVMQAVLGLVDKSMLQLQPAPSGRQAPRLRLLETTRLHAAQALRQQASAAERRQVLARHVRCMADIAQRARDDFFAASDLAWSQRWMPDFDDLMLAFDRAHAAADPVPAAAIIELLVLGSNITGRVDPALHRAAPARALAEHADALSRARLLGWGNQLQGTGLTLAAAAVRRVDTWRAVGDGPAGRQGLCTALAMLALTSEEAGDRATADQALAECRLLEDPAWSPRLRRRCSWLALRRMALLRDDPDLRAESEQLSHRMVDELMRIGAWREAGIVEGHLAQIVRLQGRNEAAVAMLRQLAADEAARGGRVDAGIYLGQAAAALLETLDPTPGAADVAPAAREAAAMAVQALEWVSPLPALVRHFMDALALLACHLGDPAQAAVLLAGADRLRCTQGYALDAPTAGLVMRLQEVLARRLPATRLQQCQARGAGMEVDALRLEALGWLRARRLGQAAPQVVSLVTGIPLEQGGATGPALLFDSNLQRAS